MRSPRLRRLALFSIPVAAARKLWKKGAMLAAFMKAKAHSDKAAATAWASVGLPTKRDQERTLHKLNTLESRLLDLEERRADAGMRGELSGGQGREPRVAETA